MAKKSKGLFTLAVITGAALGTAYYFLQKQNKRAEESGEEYDDFDDFDSSDLTEDDFVDESEPLQSAAQTEDAEADATDASADTDASGESGYIPLHFKGAQQKASALCSTVADALGEAVHKIRTSEEYEAVTDSLSQAVSGTIHKIKSSDHYETVTETISDTVNRIKNSDEFQAGEDHLESALHFVREATEKAVDKVEEKLNTFRADYADVCDTNSTDGIYTESVVITPAPEETETTGETDFAGDTETPEEAGNTAADAAAPVSETPEDTDAVGSGSPEDADGTVSAASVPGAPAEEEDPVPAPEISEEDFEEDARL